MSAPGHLPVTDTKCYGTERQGVRGRDAWGLRVVSKVSGLGRRIGSYGALDGSLADGATWKGVGPCSVRGRCKNTENVLGRVD